MLVALALGAAFVWSVHHARYARAPSGRIPPAEFSVAPSAVQATESTQPAPRPPKAVEPNHLYIPSLGVSAAIVREQPVFQTSADRRTVTLPVPPVKEVGLNGAGGLLDGVGGTVLVAGHVNLNGARGAFWNLDRTKLGADIWTTDSAGHLTLWRAYANPVIPKTSSRWPYDVFDDGGPRRLVLVTCTGSLHYESGYGYSYDDNQFVYAAPVRT